MAVLDSTAGGLDSDEEVDSPGATPTTFGGFGSSEDYGDAADDSKKQGTVDYLTQLQERAAQSATGAYGQNAAQRWSGTPAIGLSLFAGHPAPNIAMTTRSGRPYYTKRSQPGAPQAQPPEGLISGKAIANQQHGFDVSGLGGSLTPNADWNKMFPRTSPAPSAAAPSPGGGQRSPVLSRLGTSGSFTPSYALGTSTNPEAFAY